MSRSQLCCSARLHTTLQQSRHGPWRMEHAQRNLLRAELAAIEHEVTAHEALLSGLAAPQQSTVGVPGGWAAHSTPISMPGRHYPMGLPAASRVAHPAAGGGWDHAAVHGVPSGTYRAILPGGRPGMPYPGEASYVHSAPALPSLPAHDQRASSFSAHAYRAGMGGSDRLSQRPGAEDFQRAAHDGHAAAYGRPQPRRSFTAEPGVLSRPRETRDPWADRRGETADAVTTTRRPARRYGGGPRRKEARTRNEPGGRPAQRDGGAAWLRDGDSDDAGPDDARRYGRQRERSRSPVASEESESGSSEGRRRGPPRRAADSQRRYAGRAEEPEGKRGGGSRTGGSRRARRRETEALGEARRSGRRQRSASRSSSASRRMPVVREASESPPLPPLRGRGGGGSSARGARLAPEHGGARRQQHGSGKQGRGARRGMSPVAQAPGRQGRDHAGSGPRHRRRRGRSGSGSSGEASGREDGDRGGERARRGDGSGVRSGRRLVEPEAEWLVSSDESTEDDRSPAGGAGNHTWRGGIAEAGNRRERRHARRHDSGRRTGGGGRASPLDGGADVYTIRGRRPPREVGRFPGQGGGNQLPPSPVLSTALRGLAAAEGSAGSHGWPLTSRYAPHTPFPAGAAAAVGLAQDEPIPAGSAGPGTLAQLLDAAAAKGISAEQVLSAIRSRPNALVETQSGPALPTTPSHQPGGQSAGTSPLGVTAAPSATADQAPRSARDRLDPESLAQAVAAAVVRAMAGVPGAAGADSQAQTVDADELSPPLGDGAGHHRPGGPAHRSEASGGTSGSGAGIAASSPPGAVAPIETSPAGNMPHSLSASPRVFASRPAPEPAASRSASWADHQDTATLAASSHQRTGGSGFHAPPAGAALPSSPLPGKDAGISGDLKELRALLAEAKAAAVELARARIEDTCRRRAEEAAAVARTRQEEVSRAEHEARHAEAQAAVRQQAMAEAAAAQRREQEEAAAAAPWLKRADAPEAEAARHRKVQEAKMVASVPSAGSDVVVAFGLSIGFPDETEGRSIAVAASVCLPAAVPGGPARWLSSVGRLAAKVRELSVPGTEPGSAVRTCGLAWHGELMVRDVDVLQDALLVVELRDITDSTAAASPMTGAKGRPASAGHGGRAGIVSAVSIESDESFGDSGGHVWPEDSVPVAWSAVRLFGVPRSEPGAPPLALADGAGLVLRSGPVRLPLLPGQAPGEPEQLSRSAIRRRSRLSGTSIHITVGPGSHEAEGQRSLRSVCKAAWEYRDVLRLAPQSGLGATALPFSGARWPGALAELWSLSREERDTVAGSRSRVPVSASTELTAAAAAKALDQASAAQSSPAIAPGMPVAHGARRPAEAPGADGEQESAAAVARWRARRASTQAAASAAAAAAVRELELRAGTVSTSPGEAGKRGGRHTGPPAGTRLAPLARPGMCRELMPPGVPDVIEPVTEGEEAPWVAAQLPHCARLPFGPNDGFDVYVDSASFCPDNLGVSKVVFKAMTASYTVIGDPMEKSSLLDCSLIEPQFSAYAAFRPGISAAPASAPSTTAGTTPGYGNAPEPTATALVTAVEASALSGGTGIASSLDPAGGVGGEGLGVWDWDPSLTLVFRVDGLDAHSNKLHAAGYAVLNVFSTDDADADAAGRPTPTGERQPSSHTLRSKWRLNAGAFQLPLHMGPPDRRNQPMSGRVLDDSGISRVPCSTLLVRITKVPRLAELPADVAPAGVPGHECAHRDGIDSRQWSAAGLDVLPPAFRTRSYDSSRCVPRPQEVPLYPRRAELDVPTVRQAIALFAADKADGVPARGLEDIPHPDADDDELTYWLDNKLDCLPKSMLDFRYLCPYVPSAGMSVSVDGVSNSPAGQILRVACCPIAGDRPDQPPLLSPAAARISSRERGTGDPDLVGRDTTVSSLGIVTSSSQRAPEWLSVSAQAAHPLPLSSEAEPAAGPGSATPWFVTNAGNWSAPCTLQAFRDGFTTLHEPFLATTCLLFKLFASEVFAGGHSLQTEPVGWAVMPVFDKRGEGYTRRGAFVVPVLAGAGPPPWLAEKLRADPTQIDSLIQSLVAGTTGERDAPRPLLVPPGEPVSILVRLNDGQLDSLIPIPTTRYSTSLAPKPVRGRFQLNARMALHKEQSRMGTILPRSLAASDADEALVRAVRAIIEGRASPRGVFSIAKAKPGTSGSAAATRSGALAAARLAAGAKRGMASRAKPAGISDRVARSAPALAAAEEGDGSNLQPQYGIQAFASSASDSAGPDDAAEELGPDTTGQPSSVRDAGMGVPPPTRSVNIRERPAATSTRPRGGAATRGRHTESEQRGLRRAATFSADPTRTAGRPAPTAGRTLQRGATMSLIAGIFGRRDAVADHS